MSVLATLRASARAVLPSAATPEEPPAAAVRQQLASLLGSRAFEKSERLRSFLSFIIEETLEGRGAALKEYSIAATVFRKTESYDPKSDALVRVEAGRLRKKLDSYYADPGASDPIIISLPKGAYLPQVAWREAAQPRRLRYWISLALTLVLLLWVAWFFARAARRSFGTHVPEFGHDTRTRDLYWSGIYLRRSDSVEDLARSAVLLEHAAARQPGNARILGSLAGSYARMAVGPVAAWQEYSRKSLRMAEAAHLRDADVAESWDALGLVELRRWWDWHEAERCFGLAMEVEPAYAPAYLHLALGLATHRRLAEAGSYLERGCALDPVGCLSGTDAALVLYCSRRYPEARARAVETLSLRPDWPGALAMVGLCDAALGRLADAAERFRAGSQPGFSDAYNTARLANALGRMGRQGEARELIAVLEARSRGQFVPLTQLAWAYLGIGDRDHALELLWQACSGRETELVFLAVDPIYEPLAGEGRFDALLKRVDLGR